MLDPHGVYDWLKPKRYQLILFEHDTSEPHAIGSDTMVFVYRAEPYEFSPDIHLHDHRTKTTRMLRWPTDPLTLRNGDVIKVEIIDAPPGCDTRPATRS